MRISTLKSLSVLNVVICNSYDAGLEATGAMESKNNPAASPVLRQNRGQRGSLSPSALLISQRISSADMVYGEKEIVKVDEEKQETTCSSSRFSTSRPRDYGSRPAITDASVVSTHEKAPLWRFNTLHLSTPCPSVLLLGLR